MKVDLIYDSNGDWAAVYVDGKIFCQKHSISDDVWKSILAKAGVEVNQYQEADFSETGVAPETLDKVEVTYG